MEIENDAKQELATNTDASIKPSSSDTASSTSRCTDTESSITDPPSEQVTEPASKNEKPRRKRVALYARVSKAGDQTPENQLLILRQWAINNDYEVFGEFVDQISSKGTRPQKEAVLRLLRLKEVDGVGFWSLDRWGRTMTELVLEMEEFGGSGKTLMSYQEALDLGTSAGRLAANVIAALANFERDRIRERTYAGIARVRAQGKRIGRPPKK
jgi:DNA invertase Pin-like site-specific DNA recombinase